MPGDTTIEWATKSWNPVTGCTKVSAGCDHCYAETFAERWRGVPGHSYEQGFDLKLWPERLEIPLRWKRPQRIFVNSMSDLFHADIPDPFIQSVFDTMKRAWWHQFLILTKRPQRMKRWVTHHNGIDLKHAPLAGFSATSEQMTPKPLPNVWLGTSIENNEVVWRADFLRQTPAAIRFLSLEPMLGPVDMLDLAGIDWVITGGESGPPHRRFDPDWARAVRDRCLDLGIAYFHKQNGGRTPKAGGRELDGRIWDEYPAWRQEA
jgi:protein gp37